MKNNFFKFFAFLTLLFCVGVGEMWGYGYYEKDGYFSQVRFWSNNDGGKVSCGLGETASDQNWNDPERFKLILDGFSVNVYKKKDVENITSSTLYYRFYKPGETPPDYSTVGATSASENGEYNGNINQTWYTDGKGIDLLANAGKGGEYYFDYYFYTDGPGYLSNNSTQYRIKFIIKNRVFATSYSADGIDAWSNTARPLTDGKYVLTNVTGGTDIKFKLPFSGDWDNFVFNWDKVGGNTKLGNTAISDADYDKQIKFTTPSGDASNVSIKFTGSAVKVDCYQDRYSVSVEAGAHGSVSTSSVSSIDPGAVSSGEITATPDANYYFTGWTLPSGVNAADGYTYASNPIKIHASASDKTITANFARKWTIKGGNTASEDDDDDAMGDWKIFNDLDPIATANTFEGTIHLPARTAYRFKIYDTETKTWYGCGTRDHDYTFAGQTDSVVFNSTGNDGHNIMLLTGSEGDYLFRWNSSTKKLNIVYPSTVHPSVNYVYMEKYSDWNEGNLHCYIHYWKTVDETDTPLTEWGTDDPKMTGAAYFSDKSKYFYMLPALTEYPKFRVKDNIGNATEASGHDTDNQEVTDAHKGHYVYYDNTLEDWTWGTFSVHIGIDDRSATTPVNPTYMDVAFNSEVLTDLTSTPLKTHYDFGGFYTGWNSTTSTVSGTKVINERGEWVASIANYTDASKHWIKDGSSNTLYAKWTKHPYAITLAVEPNHVADSDPATGGTIQIGGEDKTSMNAYQDSASVDIYAVPAAGYKFKEWQFSKTGEVYDVYVHSGDYTSTSNPVKIRAGHTGTLTAVFEPRFSLAGDKYDGTGNGGMYGWATAYDNSDAFFTVNSTSPVNLTCTCTLAANTRYKFEVHDRYQNKNLGAGTDNEYKLLDGAYVDMTVQDINVTFTTTGEQRYIFQIYEFNGDERPRLKILWPRQVNFGWKYADADAMSTLKESGGGTVTAYVHEEGVKTAVSNGGYIMQGSTVSFTAHSYNDYNFAGWWSDYSYSSDKPFATADSTWWPVTTSNANGYAKYVEKTDTLKSGTTWNTGTWSAGHQPTADEVAIIQSPVEVDITTAKAKKVLIMQNSTNTGQLEIPAGKELVVRTTIRKTTDGSTYGATGENDIIIGSTLANGNGALVMNEHDGTNKATVYFATKAKTTGEGENKHNVNQFIGTPFNDENDILYDYYGTKIYEFRAGQDGTIGDRWWRRLAGTGDKMQGFLGYNILTNQTTEPVLEMTGTLCKAEEHSVDGYYGDASHREYLFANSWVAPIYIPNFEDGDFTNMDKTIYIFNAGTVADQGEHSTADGTFTNTSPGQYIVIPINSSEWVGDPTVKVIPSMQAFSVFANDENPKLTFNYTRLVYNPANGTAGIVPNRAPQRTNDEDAPNVLRLAATGESGYAAKIVLLERTDFTDGYDDGWDGRFLAGDDAAPQLYAVTSDGNMAINCVPEVEGTVLGFKAGEADEVFTFSFDYDGEALYLYDTQTQTYTRVLTGNTYTFTTNDLAAHNRFILTHNAPQSPTGVENTQEQKTVKFIENDHLYIFQNGRLYDAAGRIVK